MSKLIVAVIRFQQHSSADNVLTVPLFIPVSLCSRAVMAELDLSLSDALTDSVPQPGPENLVERDFVAELEAEQFEDQVGESVGKTDYIPLLDNDDTRAGEKDVILIVRRGQVVMTTGTVT